MKQYSVDIQVDFEEPRLIPPGKGNKQALRAVGYFRYFYCSAGSKDKAKQMALDFVRFHETHPKTCRFRCDRVAWMRGLTSVDQLAHTMMGLTEHMFERRHNQGVWCDSGKQYYVSEADSLESLLQPES